MTKDHELLPSQGRCTYESGRGARVQSGQKGFECPVPGTWLRETALAHWGVSYRLAGRSRAPPSHTCVKRG